MTSAPPLRIAAALVLVFYPVMVYFGLRSFDARLIALILVAAALLRAFFAGGNAIGVKQWLPAAALVAGLTLVTGDSLGLLLFPVLMNAALLYVFGISLVRPPTVIERIARLQHGELPAAAVSYTRKVTLVWCVFFALNGSIAAITVFLPHAWWALYNGCIAYILMGLLFGGEWLLRPKVGKRNGS